MSDVKTSEADRIQRRLQALRERFPDAEPVAGGVLESVFEDDDWPLQPPSDAIEVQLFGQPDDHLRLVTLLADRIGDRGDRDCAAVCTSRDESWPRRRDAFKHLLGQCRKRQIPLYIVDPDALLAESGAFDSTSARSARSPRWDDHSFAQQRAEVLDDIIQHVSENARSVLLRPAPEADVSQRLAHLKWDVELSDEMVGAAERKRHPVEWTKFLMTLAPACRAVALKSLSDEDVVSEGAASARNLLTRAWSRLTEPAARDAQVTAALRGRQVVNGHYGPLLIKSGAHPDPKLDPRTRRRLEDWGWLTPTHDERGAEARWMHRPLRDFVQRQEDGRAAADRVHQFLAERDTARQELPERLETHHHAVCSSNVRRALDTAEHYTGHLRQLALRLSEGGDYEEAVRVYRFILQHEPDDAYAWEYLAYNGALAGHEITPVLEAFTRACQLDPDNPLYRGRLLGYRVQMGHEVDDDFDRWMTRFTSAATPDFDAVSYFAEAVLNGVERGVRKGPQPSQTAQVASRITGRWHSELVQVPRLRRFSTSSYWAG